MSIVLLVIGILCLTSALVAVIGPTDPYDLSVQYFLLAWPLGEVPFFALGLQVVTMGVLWALGALHHPTGVVGLVLVAVSWPLLVVLQRRAALTADVIDAALAEAHIDVAPREPVDKRLLWTPFRKTGRGVVITRDISYGPHGKRNLLNVYTPTEGATHAPVLIFLHGGAWTMGNKDQQGFPLISHLVGRGWVCVSINYRLAPKARWPAMADDVKAAITWVRDNIAAHGGDPSFIALSGGSAGGHLTAVVALDPAVGVQAAVPCYGAYDFHNSNLSRGERRNNKKFLARRVMAGPAATHQGDWDSASPLTNVNAEAPPFFVLHGQFDSMLVARDTRHFVAALRAVTREPVAYAELPGAQHQFDMFWSLRTLEAIEGIGRFLDWARERQLVS